MKTSKRKDFVFLAEDADGGLVESESGELYVSEAMCRERISEAVNEAFEFMTRDAEKHDD